MSNADQSLEQNYAGVFGAKLVPGRRPALLLVDMVTAYIDPKSPLFCDTAAAASNVAARLAAAARSAGCPVVFTGVEFEPGGSNGGLFYLKVPSLRLFDRGSEYARFPEHLQPDDGDLFITKQYPSAFFGTGLDELLRTKGIDTLVICGYSTSGCVRASALDTLQYGFAPFVVKDGCADRHAAPHESNLFDLQQKYAEVIEEAEALQILEGRHPAAPARQD